MSDRDRTVRDEEARRAVADRDERLLGGDVMDGGRSPVGVPGPVRGCGIVNGQPGGDRRPAGGHPHVRRLAVCRYTPHA